MEISNVSAIQISLLVGLLATLFGLVPGVWLAWILARKDFPGKSLLNVVVFFPMVSPPLVTGYLLLKMLGKNSVIGSFLSQFDLAIPFSLLGAILASLVVGFPLFVMLMRSTFAGLDPQLEDYALSAGHKPLAAFLKVVLPLSYPGIIAGAVIFFARSLGEFGATIVLAGNKEGVTRTISLAIYSLMDSPQGDDQAQNLLLASLLISFLSLLAYEFFTRRYWKKIEWK